MTVYADYDFYNNEYLQGRDPAVAQKEFAFYARSASKLIDIYTFGNIDSADVPDEVRLCCCELAEQICNADHSEIAGKEGVASESVLGWSQSYESTSSRKEAAENAQRSCVYKWLSGTGLLFAGVRPC